MASTTEIMVTLPGGRRVDAQVGRHTIHTDQPTSNGGQDAAPAPFDLFLASMGACAGIFVQGFCAKRGIPYEETKILEQTQYDANGVLHAVDFDIQLLPAFPEKYREALVEWWSSARSSEPSKHDPPSGSAPFLVGKGRRQLSLIFSLSILEMHRRWNEQ